MKNNIRKIFDVIIHKTVYSVYDIDGKEHFGHNDTPKTWWLYYSEQLPDSVIPPIDSEYWKPFCSRSINRRLWDIRINQYNTSKSKWDDIQFSNGTNVEMWCNNKLIYSFGTFDLSFAFAKIQYLKVVLSEHPYNFFEPEKENGRKICWYGLPATIKNSYHPGEIKIIPDYNAGLNKEEWWEELRRRKHKFTNKDDFDKQLDELDDDNEEYQDDEINWGDALSDEHIYWFRK